MIFSLSRPTPNTPANRSVFASTRVWIAYPCIWWVMGENRFKGTPGGKIDHRWIYRILFGLRSTRAHARIFFFNFIKIKLSDCKEDNFILFYEALAPDFVEHFSKPYQALPKAYQALGSLRKISNKFNGFWKLVRTIDALIFGRLAMLIMCACLLYLRCVPFITRCVNLSKIGQNMAIFSKIRRTAARGFRLGKQNFLHRAGKKKTVHGDMDGLLIPVVILTV